MTDFFDAVAGRLIVSAQAYPGEPMRDPRTMVAVAESAVRGGAAAIRLQGLDDIRLGAETLDVPVIGLWKDGKDGVFITPTLEHAVAVAAAGADVVALDGTRRERPDGRTLAEVVKALRNETDALVMADCGSAEDAIAATEAGADIIGTTLAGYTGERPRGEGPDLDLIAELRALALGRFLVAEGRIHTPEHARQALEAGADSVVVGTAITHPQTITSWFARAVEAR
ncbi:N-acetylmannosamine-6-phosphate 2-epimerase [Leifsonia shinshuensis]|uniref:Putative N-acetylmannosamine-6-phosphate 2-epimerase n=1 Tax=Leifsonia shinshuensis TaxID=150026 RepID=A0A7G6YBI8_9MICO|nr:N-acetylmannosamine-6-phosphate 2-epimerase [Leifsonia shinshuensis]QNE35853.1 N-acetylmannosamine-6-phosphate 2-epimerase [Leifsonia shinshuensis]